MHLNILLNRINWRRLAEYTLCFCVFLAICSTAAYADDAQVIIETGAMSYSDTGFAVDVTVTFKDMSLYNEQVYLSYHVVDENGEYLLYENQRLPFHPDAAFTTVYIEWTSLEEIADRSTAVIQFDLVDEANVYWFSENSDIIFQTASVGVDREMLSPSAPQVPNTGEMSTTGPHTSVVSTVFSITLNIIVWAVLAVLLGFSIKRRNNLSGPNAPSRETSLIYRILDWRWFPACLFFVYFLIPFIVHADYLAAGETLVSGDGLLGLYQLQYVGESIKQLDFPIWTPYLAGGMPYGDATTIGALYPVGILCALLPPFIQLYAFFGIHYAIGGIFLYLYLRKIDCDAIVCVAVSTIYLFTVHMGGSRKEHVSLIVTALWVPVILFFLENYLQKRKIKWIFLASAAMALQFFGGFLQYVVYSDIFVFFYLFLSGIHRKFSIKTMLKHGISWLAAYFGFIAAGVFPLIKFMLLLSDSGGEKMSMEIFSGYSLHPIKLLMAVFPKIFGPGVWDALIERNFSSGVDAELVLGAPCIALILLGVSLAGKNFYARFACSAGMCCLIYACIGQFNLLKKIAYHIPILNMFRVPSRVLFLFTLCGMILLAVAMSTLFKQEKASRCFHIVNAAIAVCMVGIFCFYSVSDSICEGAAKLPLRDVFLIPFLAYILYIIVAYGYLWLKKTGLLTITSMRGYVALTVALLTIIQMWPYYKYTNNSSYEKLVSWPEEIADRENKGKIWCPDLSFGEIGSNESLVSRYPSLNSYTNFNLPNLYKLYYHTDHAPMNSSGMYMTFGNAENSLKNSNGLLSMLGVKYIIVHPDTKLDGYVQLDDYTVESTILTSQESNLLPADGFQYAAWPISLTANSWYRIELTLEADTTGDNFYVDFAGGLDYDFAEQEAWFTTVQGVYEYEAIIPSGNSDIAADILFRVIALTDQPVSISSVIIEKVEPTITATYQLIANKGEYCIYENLCAKELFYPVSKVNGLNEEGKTNLYLNTNSYDILDTSYITGGEADYDFSEASVQISNIQLRNNRASADVQTDQNTFINMSQTYYPGWNAYVDGVKTKVYEVNGIIQGIFVPAGTHVVEFCYQPVAFYAGITVSIATIIVCALFGSNNFKGRKRRGEECKL